jgi:hypothetical protein
VSEKMKLRIIANVIDEMLPYVESEKLKEELKYIQEKSFFVAPEDSRRCWDALAYSINKHIPTPPETEKQLKVVSIFIGKSEEEIKSMFNL